MRGRELNPLRELMGLPGKPFPTLPRQNFLFLVKLFYSDSDNLSKFIFCFTLNPGNLQRGGTVKKAFLVSLVLFLASSLGVFGEKPPKDYPQANTSLVENIIKRLALIKVDNDLLPAIIFGKKYVIVPTDSIIYKEDSGMKIFKQFTISYEGKDFSSSQVKIVADYKGIALLEIASPFESNLPLLALAPLETWNQKVYYIQFFLYKSGTAFKSLLLVEEAKVAAISDGLFFIDKGFFGAFRGIGIFNEKGQLVGIAIDNMSVVFEKSDFSLPKYGIVVSSQTFAHFRNAVR